MPVSFERSAVQRHERDWSSFRPRLIACDLDGTLLLPDGTVSARNRAALQAARAQGFEVVIATGRPLRTALPIAESLGLSSTLIAYNGAAMHWNDQLRIVKHLKPDAARAALERLRREAPSASLALETASGWYFEPGEGIDPAAPHGTTAHLFRGGPPNGVGALEQFIGLEPIKLNVVYDDAHPSELARHLHGLDLVGVWSLPYLLEVHDSEVDKSAALAWLCEQLAIDASHVAAFGDQQNDVGMLRWAGAGVAMGNALAEAREAADMVTATNSEDGVAQLVEKWLVATGERALALDVGDARIGLATGTVGSPFAFGRGFITRVGTKRDVPAVLEAAVGEAAEVIVVGLPLRLDGSVSPQTERVLRFVEALRSAGARVVLEDERLTTRIAQREVSQSGLRRAQREEKGRLDEAAAVHILESFLQRHLAEA